MTHRRTPVYRVALPSDELTCQWGEPDGQPKMDVLGKPMKKVA